MALNRFIPVYLGTGKKGQAKGLLLTSFLALIVTTALCIAIILLFHDSIITPLFKDKGVYLYFKYLLIAVPFYLGCELLLSAFQSRRLFFQNTVVKSSRYVLIFIFLFILSLWDVSGSHLLISFSMGSIAALMVGLYYCKDLFKDIGRAQPVYEYKKWFSFAIPTFFTGYVYLLMTEIDRIMLGMFAPAQEVGIYNASARVALQIMFPAVILTQTFLPSMSKLYHCGEREKLIFKFKQISKWNLTFTFLLFLYAVLFADEILGLFGDAFLDGRTILILLSSVTVMLTGFGPVGFMLRVGDGQNAELLITSIFGVFNILLNLILIPILGGLGAALASAASMVLINVAIAGMLYQKDKITGLSVSTLKRLTAGGLTYLVMFNVKVYSTHLSLALLPIVYLGFIYVTRIDDTDLELIYFIRAQLRRNS